MGDQQFYERDGKKYERVTTILDVFPHPKLIDWKINLGRKASGIISRKALKIGSRVDELCENDMLTGKYKLTSKDPEEVRNCMLGWEEWKKEWPDFKDVQGTQETVFFDDWMVAGTLDFCTSRKLVDIKTSRQISRTYWIQTAVYNRAKKLPERWVLRLMKNIVGYEYVKCPKEYSQEYLENCFVGRLVNYHFEKESEK